MISKIMSYLNFQMKNTEDAMVIQTCVRGFIEMVWNDNDLTNMNYYLHPGFIDHSIPFYSLQNQVGLILYLEELNARVYHQTAIVDLVAVQEFVVADIRICAVRIAADDLKPEIISGIRLFKMVDGKIMEHWEFMA